MKLVQDLPEIFEEFGEKKREAFLEIKEYKDKMTELLENGELKIVEKSLDVYFKLLAKAVNDERGMNE